MANRRAARVARRIQQEASQIILYELRDPRIQLVTITKVDISDDLRHATIYFSVFGDEAQRRTAARGLASARGLVRSRVAKSLRLREAPLITFEFDPTIERAIEVSRLIDQVAAELHDGEQPHDAEPQDDTAQGEEQAPQSREDPRPEPEAQAGQQ
jgi:ribosome-binding factor A